MNEKLASLARYLIDLIFLSLVTVAACRVLRLIDTALDKSGLTAMVTVISKAKFEGSISPGNYCVAWTTTIGEGVLGCWASLIGP